MSTIRYMLCITLWIWSVILPWTLLGTVTTIIAGFLLLMYPAWDSKKKDSNGHPNKPRHEKWFYAWLIGLSALGGFWALFLPLALNQKFDGPNADGNQLRLHLLYITGGVLALTTLGETHRKNTLEKHKNDQDHTRQVHAERRSRYTTAVEQLSSDKTPIRLGGVYTLAGLVDEWLSDKKTTLSPEERRKEGQVIINNLCAYIRSPLPLAERAEQLDKDYAKDLKNDFDGDIEKFDADKRAFARDKAALEEERQVRQSIIEEIHKRLQYIGTPGSWSKLDYDFSNAHFFYPIVFTNSCFDASSRFFGATFTQDADFSMAKFTDADFSMAKFTDADFSMAKFTGNANFSMAKFTDADFFMAEFTGNANFSKAKFTDADFSGVEFTGDANFFWAKFTEDTDFSGVEFTGDANFFEAEFTGNANFFEAEFTGNANFSGATFEEKPIFERALGDKTYKARFSYKADPEDYNFKVSHNSRYKIETEEKEYNGAKFIIPKGTELFDPDEPSEQGNNDGN